MARLRHSTARGGFGAFGGSSGGFGGYSGSSGSPNGSGAGGGLPPGGAGGAPSGTPMPHYGGTHGYPCPTKVFTMKPELKLFPQIKDEDQCVPWHKKFYGVMKGTGMGDVANSNYSPQPHERESFLGKSRWMCTALDATLLTTEGRNILDRHRLRGDGQAVLKEFVACMSKSTSSQLRARELMNKLVNNVLTPEWNYTYAEYLNWFMRTVFTYNGLVANENLKLKNDTIRTMLDRNIQGVGPLIAVRDREEYDMTRGATPLNFSEYLTLLKNAAARMDAKRKVTRRTQSRTSNRRRSANVHEFSGDTDNDG